MSKTMRMTAIETTNHLICRVALPLLCLMVAVTVARGDDSRRQRDSWANRLRSGPTTQHDRQSEQYARTSEVEKRTSNTQAPRDLESTRVKLAPGQKLQQANYLGQSSQASSPAASAQAANPNQQASAHQRTLETRQSVVRANYEHHSARCDGCGSHSCDGGCDVGVEPACGLEPGCGCDVCVQACEPACGCQHPCGGECGIEPGCGISPAYGCDSICSPNQLGRGKLGRFSDPCLQNFSIRGEYLLWWVDGFSIPPLLTTSSPGTSRDDAGVLGLPSTSIVYGNQSLLDGVRSGGRVTMDFWFDCNQTHGIEAIYTGLATERSTFSANSQQYPILARPFFNVEPGVGQQDAELIAFPGLLEGGALVESESTLQGVELLYRHNYCRDCCFRLDWLAGWRYNRLDEELHFSDFKRVIGDGIGLPIGTTLTEADWFETRNSFNGPEVGILAEARHCCWTLEWLMKLALGNNHSEVGIDGHAEFNVPGAQPPVTTTPAGLLAQGTNIGVHESDDFAVIPELGVTLGYDVNCHWRATLGYTFMYWSQVARPGDQVDLDLNLTQLESTGLVGTARPRPTGILTDVWAQGFRFGLESRY